MVTSKKLPSSGSLGSGLPRLLIVDDVKSVAKALRMMMRGHFDITLAYDGIAATTLLQEGVFDIILLDIRLPGIDGIELLRVIRAQDLDVPVVLMTGDPTFTDAVRAIELGAIGFVVKPVDSGDLIRRLERGVAMAALTKMKREATELGSGSGGHVIADRVGLAVRLDAAIAQLTLVFQPIVSVRERRIAAFEALMRSREAALGSPAAILDVAERLDRVEDVTQRVMVLAAEAMPRVPLGARLFVNIHAHDIRGNRIFGESCPPHAHAKRVVLEVTERGALEDIPGLPLRAQNLRGLGFRIAIDDLGAGYAGLTTFASIEPEIVKIDMSLVRAIEMSVIRQRIVSSIVRLARELSIEVVAEGIETSAELACVIDLGVDYVQGYLIGTPKDSFEVTFPAW